MATRELLKVIEPFDPLSVEHIGVTLAVELLEQQLELLPPKEKFSGAGVYALYYSGKHAAYKGLVDLKEKTHHGDGS